MKVYWTEHRQWYDATFVRSQVEKGDDGGVQRASCVRYDAAGDWRDCDQRELTYWHCLDDEWWQHEAAGGDV